MEVWTNRFPIDSPNICQSGGYCSPHCGGERIHPTEGSARCVGLIVLYGR
jgi:hypothetical protein